MAIQDLTTLERVKAWLGIPNGEILSVAITAEGSGYHAETTTVSLSDVLGQGTGFDAVPVILGGKVKAVVVLDPGSLYLKGTPPTVVFADSDVSPGTGAGASLTSDASTNRIAEIQSEHDALLSHLISAASVYFYQKTSRNVLISASVTEKKDGHAGMHYVALKENPITAVSSVALDGVPVSASVGPTRSGYGFDSDGVFLRGQVFPDGFQNVEISYTAGYASDSAEAAVIEQAVIEMVGAKFRRRLHIDETSRTIVGGSGQTVSYSQRDVPPEAAAIIQKFSRPVIFG